MNQDEPGKNDHVMLGHVRHHGHDNLAGGLRIKVNDLLDRWVRHAAAAISAYRKFAREETQLLSNVRVGIRLYW